MSGEKIAINRRLVGVLTLVCWAAFLAILILAPRDESWTVWLAGFVRVGLLMSAFWLALPSRHREAAWVNVSPATFVGLILVVILLPRFPRVIVPLLIVLLVVGFVLRPRRKQRFSSRTDGKT